MPRFAHPSRSLTLGLLAVAIVPALGWAGVAHAQRWSVVTRFARHMEPAIVQLGNDDVAMLGGPTAIEDAGARIGRDGTGEWCELWRPGANRVQRLASLGRGRMGAVAVALSDGRILLAGGLEHGGGVGSAELYEAGADRWRPTGAMVRPRTDARAVALADGRVLMVGGLRTDNMANGSWTSAPAPEAETWDPTTDAWTSVGEPGEPRETPTVTVLADGRVLVTGGGDGAGHGLASAALFDPSTDRWSIVATMAEGRESHTATLLDDGRVLVVGGNLRFDPAQERFVSSAEIWDPRSGQWSEVAPLALARRGHAAVKLADGRVLVSGGEDIDASTMRGTTLTARSEIFDPTTTSWSAGTSLPAGRSRHSTLRTRDGRVVIVGGLGEDGRPERSIVIGTP